MSKKRILWLLNHTTLRDFEVPMLIDMGFEVFCPKIYQYYFGDLSASVTFAYDKSLTIPPEVLEEMNKIDFYVDVPYCIKTMMNQNFDIVVFGAFSEQVNYLVDSFHGILIMHAFGLNRNNSYSSIFATLEGPQLLDKIERVGGRFFFGQAYDVLTKIESNYFKSRSIDLPIGLKNAHVNKKWIGGDHRILFICPKINTDNYFRQTYDKFLTDFKGFDYLIGGSQLTPVTSNPKVLGFVPAEQYEYNMTRLDVMFYHSQEPRHLHYHPLEAVKNGMPLVFMAAGMLDVLGGERLPGRCTSIKQARRKITRIFEGDKKFIQDVVNSQPILLEKFTYDYCRTNWGNALEQIKKSYVLCDRTSFPLPKKIAIILPAEYTGGVLDYTIRFIKAFVKGLNNENNASQLTLVHFEHKNYEGINYFKEIKELGVSVQKFRWKHVNSGFLKNYYKIKNINISVSETPYFMMDNSVNYLNEFDHLIFMSDMMPQDYLNFRPYTVVAHDYLQRYVPNFYKDFYEKSRLEFQRKANHVLVTSLPTRQDAINYGGIAKSKIALTPLLFEQVQYQEIENKTELLDQPEQFFLWSTNPSEHKNHKVALDALRGYYENGGSLKCIITGSNSHFLTDTIDGENEYTEKIRALFTRTSCFEHNIYIKGNVDKNLYFNYLKNAAFLFHPGYGDNGNGSVFDAACLKVPSLSSDYPAMRYMDELFGLNVRFFNYAYSDELTQALLKMEKEYMTLKNQLPTQEALKKFTIEETYETLYQTLKNIIYF